MKTIKFITALCGVAASVCCCGEKDNPEETVTVNSITLSSTNVSLEVGEELTLQATFSPAEAEVGTVVWASSDDNVASVSQEGKISALTPGEATISVATGDVKAECEVTVTKKIINVETITLSANNVTMAPGDETVLQATFTPEDADLSSVVWSSSAEGVATVSQEGRVNAIAEGQATITVTAGEVKAECIVTVKIPAKEWAVGDYYEVGSVKGVVVWIDESKTHGKIISLDETVSLWSTNDGITGAQSETDGKANTDKVKDLNAGFTAFPSFKWCVEHGEGWYFPAISEVKCFLSAEPLVKQTLAEHGGTAIGSYYWSSTESENEPETSALWGYGYKGNNVSSDSDFKTNPEDDTFVRAMFEF